MNKLILFLLRVKLDVYKHECFRFTNQKKNCDYFISDRGIYRLTPDGRIRDSHASLNFILSEDCEIRKMGRYV